MGCFHQSRNDNIFGIILHSQKHLKYNTISAEVLHLGKCLIQNCTASDVTHSYVRLLLSLLLCCI